MSFISFSSLLISSCKASVDMRGKGTSKASGKSFSGLVSCPITKKRTFFLSLLTRIVSISSSIRLYLSTEISYMRIIMPFSLRYSKSSRLTLPHDVNLSSSVVSAEISSSSCFFLSDLVTTSEHS